MPFLHPRDTAGLFPPQQKQDKTRHAPSPVTPLTEHLTRCPTDPALPRLPAGAGTPYCLSLPRNPCRAPPLSSPIGEGRGLSTSAQAGLSGPGTDVNHPARALGQPLTIVPVSEAVLCPGTSFSTRRLVCLETGSGTWDTLVLCPWLCLPSACPQKLRTSTGRRRCRRMVVCDAGFRARVESLCVSYSNAHFLRLQVTCQEL